MGKLSGMKTSLKTLQAQVDRQRIAQVFGIDPDDGKGSTTATAADPVLQLLLERIVIVLEENQRLLGLLIASKSELKGAENDT